MSFWALVARALYESVRIATRTSVEVRDEGGLASIRGEQACVVVANHCSHSDTPILLYAMPPTRRARVRFIAGAWRFGTESSRRGLIHRAEQWFMNRLATQGFRAVLVGQDSPVQSGLDSMTEILRKGETVVLYPEGTRSRTGALGPLRQGIAHLMLRTDSPVVPTRIDGTHSLLPAGRRLFAAGGTVVVRFRAPLQRVPGETSERMLARLAVALSPEAVTP